MPGHGQEHYETGLSDEAVIEGHDLIDRAEHEEEELHKHDSNPEPPIMKKPQMSAQDNTANAGKQGSHKSTMDSVKQALHLNK